MKKQKSKEYGKRKLSWWEWAIIFLALLFILDTFDNEDYEDCVDECVDDIDYCLSYSGGYLTDSEARDCSYDLEYCVRSCK